MPVLISLYGTDRHAVIDEIDEPLVIQYKWHLHSAGYAETKIGRINTLMHRMIMNPREDLEIDHKDGNRLNNSRSNLRICTTTDNLRNRRASLFSWGTSKYKGVFWNKRNGKWSADITVNKKVYHLGFRESEEDAAMLYDAAARHYFGEFANTNFPGVESLSREQIQTQHRLSMNLPAARGVSFMKSKGKWRARAHRNGKEIHLGVFSTEEEAASAIAEFQINTAMSYPNIPPVRSEYRFKASSGTRSSDPVV